MRDTDRVRVVTYVPAALAATIDSAAAALGQSRSALCAEVLSNSGPVLEVLRDLALDLKEAPDRHREALAHLAAVLRPMVDEAHTEVGGLEVWGAGGPPPSNTGVRK